MGLISKFITRNGTYIAANDGADGYSTVTVDVTPEFTAADEGKVVENGALVAQTSLTVTENGTYNTTKNNEVVVNVSGGEDENPFSIYKNYIEASGSQYINTGYAVRNGDWFELIANIPNSGQVSYACVFGARQSTTSKQVYLLTRLTDAYVLNGQYASSTSNKFVAQTVYVSGGNNTANNARTVADTFNKKIRIVLDSAHFEVSDSSGYLWFSPISAPGDIETSIPLCVFAMNTNGTKELKLKGKLYLFRVYGSDGVMKHEYVPSQPNGIACLRDTVSGAYLYNEGTGDFTYGTDATN